MKVALLVLALVSLGLAVPSPRKAFHEHLDDFMDLIVDERGDEIAHVFQHYLEFEEFKIALDYTRTKDYKELVYEMEAIPEFKKLMDYLENDNIDIGFILDRYNEMLEEISIDRTKSARHEVSGRDFASFYVDFLALLPVDELRALYEQKREEFEDFRVAIDNLESEEINNILYDLWASEVFQAELKTLADNHIDMDAIFKAWQDFMQN